VSANLLGLVGVALVALAVLALALDRGDVALVLGPGGLFAIAVSYKVNRNRHR
jgi:hypothetical protein